MRRMFETANLPEIECIEMLEAIDDAYNRRYGAKPFNISHWDPSIEFEAQMLAHLEIPPFKSPILYQFSYQQNETPAVIKKLGGIVGRQAGLITPSTTTSILCVLNWLKKSAKRDVIALCPFYFSLSHACHNFGLKLRRAHLRKIKGCFALPSPNARIWRNPSVLWITSPVYGAGVYFTESDIRFFSDLLEKGWVVIADECLALPGREIIRSLGHHPNFVGIYSPHKCAGINGLKFSIVVFGKRHLTFMERWADVWYGGLNCSSLIAVKHFLSPNFDSYLTHFLQAISKGQTSLERLCANYLVEADSEAEGHFVTLYFPGIPSRLGNSQKFLHHLVFSTGGTLIPGNRSRFHPDLGFCFRINLARSGPFFLPTLNRILEQVMSQTS